MSVQSSDGKSDCNGECGDSGCGNGNRYGTIPKEDVSKPFSDAHVDHHKRNIATNGWYRTLMTKSSSFVLLFAVVVVVGIGCVAINDLDFFSLPSSLSLSSPLSSLSSSSSSTVAVVRTTSSSPPKKDNCPSYLYYLSYIENTDCCELFFTDNAKREYEIDHIKKIESAQKINSELLPGRLCQQRDKYHDQSLINDFVPHKPVEEYDSRACYSKVYAKDQVVPLPTDPPAWPKCHQSDLQVVNQIDFECFDCHGDNDSHIDFMVNNKHHRHHQVDFHSNNWDRNALTINYKGANNHIEFKLTGKLNAVHGVQLEDNPLINLFVFKTGYNGECEHDFKTTMTNNDKYHVTNLINKYDGERLRFINLRTEFTYDFTLKTRTTGCYDPPIPHCVILVSCFWTPYGPNY